MPSKFIIIRNRKWVISFFLFWLVDCGIFISYHFQLWYDVQLVWWFHGIQSMAFHVFLVSPKVNSCVEVFHLFQLQYNKSNVYHSSIPKQKPLERKMKWGKKTKKEKKCHTHIRKKKKINSKILFCLIVFSRRISLLYFCSCFLFVDWMWDAKRVSLSLPFSYAQYIQAVVHLSKLHMNRSLTWGFCWTHQHAEHMAVQ